MYTVKGERLGPNDTEITTPIRCEVILIARVQDVGV